MAAKPRAAAKAITTAEEMLKQVPAHPQSLNAPLERRGPGRPPKVAPSLEHAVQEVEAARHEHQRLTQVREQVGQRMRAIGHAYHCVDLERGVRRNGKLIASDIQEHIATIRTMAEQEQLSETCLERSAQAERVVPTMQATSAFVAGYVRQQVRQLDLAQPVAYAMHAPRMPSYDLDRVASTRPVPQGEPLRTLASASGPHCLRPGVPWARGARWSTISANTRPKRSRRCCSAPAPMWKGATGISRCAITSCEGLITRENVRA